MEWKPDKTSKTELEKKQSEYAKKALDMAKRSQTKQIWPNSDKEINIAPKKAPELNKPETIMPQKSEIKADMTTPETAKTKPEESTVMPETKKPEAVIPEIINEITPPPVFVKSVREAQINANFNVKGKIYKKPSEIQPYDESENATAETVEDVCDETTDNPFGTVKPQCDEVKCSPPNFKEYIKKHNEQHCSCDKCCSSKKKWI